MKPAWMLLTMHHHYLKTLCLIPLPPSSCTLNISTLCEWWISLNKTYIIISSTLTRKPMEHTNICSKLSVLNQGIVKTCKYVSSRASHCQILLQQTFLFKMWEGIAASKNLLTLILPTLCYNSSYWRINNSL